MIADILSLLEVLEGILDLLLLIDVSIDDGHLLLKSILLSNECSMLLAIPGVSLEGVQRKRTVPICCHCDSTQWTEVHSYRRVRTIDTFIGPILIHPNELFCGGAGHCT